MFETRLSIDLPSEQIHRRLSGWERLRRRFGGAIDDATGRERIALDGLAVFDALYRGLYATQLTDVLWMTVDDHLVYLDAMGHPDELVELWEEAGLLGTISAAPRELGLAVAHQFDDLRVVALLELHGVVRSGTDELHVAVSARVGGLRPRHGETAAAWRRRLLTVIGQEGWLERHRLAVQDLSDTLAAHLSAAFGDAPVSRSETWVRVEVPGPQQMGRFKTLQFGDRVASPTVRLAPSVARHGVRDEPIGYTVYDPYFELLNLLILDAMLSEGLWRRPFVRVVEPGGSVLGTGERIERIAAPIRPILDQVRFDGAGNLIIADTVPDPDELGDVIRDPVW